MGIRIHKVLGWGFKHSKYKKDPRFRPEFWEDDFLDQNIKGEFIEELSKQFLGQILVEPIKDKKVICPYEFLHYNYENKRGPIVFSFEPKWRRYDDTIDYYEKTQNLDGLYDEVAILTDEASQPCGIYPYMNFVDRRDGESVNISQSERWIITNTLVKSGQYENIWKDGYEKLEKFNDLISWQRYIVPKPDPYIEAFCKICKPFKDDLTWLRLKPMLYTYWS